MKKLLKIAKVEFNILVYSPVIWLVLPIFMVLCGINYFKVLDNIRTGLSLGGGVGNPITLDLFAGPEGLFTIIQQTLFLYLPILTMGLLSRETSSGTIKLLLSSPINLWEIVLGKFLAMVFINSIFILILFSFGLYSAYAVVDLDYGLLFAGLFGLFLLICTYAAIGLFMSSLTNYQIVAAISTLAIFSALRFVGGVGQSIDFVRDLTYFLSISGRTETMIMGLISSKDLFYYLVIIALFLSFTYIYLKNAREKAKGKKAGLRYIGALAIALLIGYVTSIPVLTFYYDATATKNMTITPEAQKVVKQINGKLKITTYINMLSPNVHMMLPEMRNNDISSQSQINRFIPHIDNHYFYYYNDVVDTTQSVTVWNPNFQGIKNLDTLANKFALLGGFNKDIFSPASALPDSVNLYDEGYITVRELEYQGRKAFLRFFPFEASPYPREPEWVAALQQLLGKHKQVHLLTGHNESEIFEGKDRGFKMALNTRLRRASLINQGFQFDTLNIAKNAILDSAAILVIGDPTLAYSEAELNRIKEYIDQGVNVLILTKSGRQDIINPILAQFGIRANTGQLVSSDNRLTMGNIKARFNPDAKGFDSNMEIFLKGPALEFESTVGFSYQQDTGYHIEPIVYGNTNVWNKIKPIDPNADALRFNTSDGDQNGNFPVGLAVSRTWKNKEQRIFVFGDAGYLSDKELKKGPMQEGLAQEYTNMIFRWLTYGLSPFKEIRDTPKDIDLRVSNTQISWAATGFKYIFPFFIVLFGAIILYKRRLN